MAEKNCSMQRAHLAITLSKIRLDLNLEQYFSILKLGFVINGDIHQYLLDQGYIRTTSL